MIDFMYVFSIYNLMVQDISFTWLLKTNIQENDDRNLQLPKNGP